MPHRPFLDSGLLVTYVLDSEHSMTHITEDTLQQLRLTTESVHRLALENLRKRFTADVVRSARVRVRYQDLDGQAQILETGDLLAICIQHEIDHLNGILFIQHLGMLKRDLIRRRIRKMPITVEDIIR